ncbi:agrin-like [Tropilaelaps mercedesae]|uniref:Agrin-like n=1 Tax=Tropilaelaps mercedesae TaxID=418985 RepID=A0A1V9X693_9ACAR|nr:agrin-like [Tropilaelaps mercedesae]
MPPNRKERSGIQIECLTRLDIEADGGGGKGGFDSKDFVLSGAHLGDTADPCAEKECQFGAECKVRLDGKTAECVCPERCTSYGDSKGSRPVCGSDGKDYPSVCELRRTACKEMREISVKYQGSCGKCHPYFISIVLK